MFRKLSAVCISLACLTMTGPALAGTENAGTENRAGFLGSGVRAVGSGVNAIGRLIFSPVRMLGRSERDIFAAYSYGMTKLGRESVGAISDAEVDDDDYGYRISGGFQYDSGLMLGFAYNDFGTTELSVESGGRYTLDGVEQTATGNFQTEVTATSYGPFVAYDIPLTVLVEPGQPDPPFSVTPKIGVHFWDYESTTRDSAGSVTVSDDDYSLYYGVDLAYDINSRMSFMLGYDRYKVSGDIYDYVYLGTQLTFF